MITYGIIIYLIGLGQLVYNLSNPNNTTMNNFIYTLVFLASPISTPLIFGAMIEKTHNHLNR